MIVPGAAFNIWPVAAPDTGCIVPWQSYAPRPVVPVTAGDSILLDSGATVIAPISGLFYNGDYGGCDECGRRIDALGTWPAGFRPTTMQITVALLENKAFSGYNPNSFISLAGYTANHAVTLDNYSGTNTYTFVSYLTGDVDITQLNAYFGIRAEGGGGDDRAFIIGDIGFDCQFTYLAYWATGEELTQLPFERTADFDYGFLQFYSRNFGHLGHITTITVNGSSDIVTGLRLIDSTYNVVGFATFGETYVVPAYSGNIRYLEAYMPGEQVGTITVDSINIVRG